MGAENYKGRIFLKQSAVTKRCYWWLSVDKGEGN